MKKVVLLLVSIMMISFTSCSKENILEKDTKVKVKVTKSGIPQNGEVVYMFNSQEINTSDSFFDPIFSDYSSVTEEGIATFYISADKFVGEKQKVFYFAIFKGDYFYKVATNIEKGKTKTLKISY